jgi:hypothetical protein
VSTNATLKNEVKRPPLINIEALKAMQAEWCKERYLPRVSGLNSEPKTHDGKLVPVGHLTIIPKFAEELEEKLIGWIQGQFAVAAHRMAESFDPDSGGVIDERFRVVPPFGGDFKLDRYDRNRSIPVG